MIFTSKTEERVKESPKQDPFIVPIATPLLSGAGLLTMIMLYSKEENDNLKIFLAILLAYRGHCRACIRPLPPNFSGKRGLSALEQLMGMLLTMIAMEMIVQGSTLFITALGQV